jgi:hypothetical protein
MKEGVGEGVEEAEEDLFLKFELIYQYTCHRRTPKKPGFSTRKSGFIAKELVVNPVFDAGARCQL